MSNLQKLRVARLAFDVEVVVKDEAFTRRGKLRKKFQRPLAQMLKFEAHKFIEAAPPDELLAEMKITREDVDVLDDEPAQEEPDENKSEL